MSQPNIVYGDQAALMPFTDDGAGPEGHYQFTIADFADLIASYGVEKVMNELFQKSPQVYLALSAHIFNDFKLTLSEPKDDGTTVEQLYS